MRYDSFFLDSNRPMQSRAGVSQRDVVVLVFVVFLIAALTIPAILQSRKSAREGKCRNNLRVLTQALNNYHDVHASYPPAAVWSTTKTSSLELHRSIRIQDITHHNWAILLLPYFGESKLATSFNASKPIGDPGNSSRQCQARIMKCPADEFNKEDNHYEIKPIDKNSSVLRFSRGNYAINGGTHNFMLAPPSTAQPQGDFVNLMIQDHPREYQQFGNGIAGINKSFSIKDFVNSRSTLVALEELRAGIDSVDPRGVWALGQIGGSITWAHGVNGDAYGPNNQHPRSDDILGCRALHQKLGAGALKEHRMPCVHYVNSNQQATSRSMHNSGVHVSFLDGSVQFIDDSIDPGLWHVIHSRNTPKNVLEGEFLSRKVSVEVIAEATGPSKSIRPHSKVDSVLVNSLDMKFASVLAGQFMMGVPDSNNSESPEDVPAHRVQISSRFNMSVHEVTRHVFARVTASEDNKSIESDFPVVNVTWHQADEFCRLLSSMPEEVEARRTYRLPTEAEWEYACRAGSDAPYTWKKHRDTDDKSGEAAGILPPFPLRSVGCYPPNEFGLHDMRGNAWEWTSDWFDRRYYSRSPLLDPTGPSSGYIKVVRGGDWRYVGEECHIDYAVMPPFEKNPVVGFRVVCEHLSPHRSDILE